MFTKLKMITAATLISVSVMPFTVNAQDLDKGMTAYNAGDYAIALKELEPLAEQGDVDAQFILGYMYDEGKGVPQDNKEAMKWYRLAAEQGDAGAEFNLGIMYVSGKGVPQDYKEVV